jgi:hypothetical protein
MLTNPFVLLCVMFFLAVIGWIGSHLTYKYMSKKYPEIWRSFKFPEDSIYLPYSEAKREGEAAKAQLRAAKFMWSRARKDLNDVYLNRLAFWHSTLFLLMVLCLLFFTFPVFSGRTEDFR